MKFDRVRKEEADTVLKLYRSLLGTPVYHFPLCQLVLAKGWRN